MPVARIAPESTVSPAPDETLTFVLAIEPGEAISSVPPLIVTAPLPLIVPEKMPPLLIVSAVGLRFSVPLPLSVAMVWLVPAKLVVPLSVRFVAPASVAPESIVRLALGETLMLVPEIEPGDASSSAAAGDRHRSASADCPGKRAAVCNR